MTRVSLLRPDDVAWGEALTGSPHDVHHLPGWAVASAPLEPGEPLAVWVSDEHGSMLVPFVRRTLEGHHWDAVSPYGYSGPSVSEDAREPWALLRAAAEHLRGEGCVSWFLRLHPLLDGWVTSTTDPALGLRQHGEVVTIDLNIDDEAFLSGLRRDHRSDVRRGQREGVGVRRGDRSADLKTFVALHQHTMAQRGAAAYHRFEPEYFDALADGLGDDLIVLIAEFNGQVVAGALFTIARGSGIVGYHLAASVPRPPRGATKLLIMKGREIGRELGCTRLLLGGGLGSAEDELFAFKAGFSTDRHRFHTLRLVLDEDEYSKRCLAVGADPVDVHAYFPAYRRG